MGRVEQHHRNLQRHITYLRVDENKLVRNINDIWPTNILVRNDIVSSVVGVDACYVVANGCSEEKVFIVCVWNGQGLLKCLGAV